MHTATITVSAGVLGMPVSFSVTSEPQTTKKGAEHQAAEMALEMLAPPPAEEALQLDASPEAAAVAGVRSACERCEPDLASLLADAASSGHQSLPLPALLLCDAVRRKAGRLASGAATRLGPQASAALLQAAVGTAEPGSSGLLLSPCGGCVLLTSPALQPALQSAAAVASPPSPPPPPPQQHAQQQSAPHQAAWLPADADAPMRVVPLAGVQAPLGPAAALLALSAALSCDAAVPSRELRCQGGEAGCSGSGARIYARPLPQGTLLPGRGGGGGELCPALAAFAPAPLGGAAAPALGGMRLNSRASWVAGAPIYGDALFFCHSVGDPLPDFWAAAARSLPSGLLQGRQPPREEELASTMCAPTAEGGAAGLQQLQGALQALAEAGGVAPKAALSALLQHFHACHGGGAAEFESWEEAPVLQATAPAQAVSTQLAQPAPPQTSLLAGGSAAADYGCGALQLVSSEGVGWWVSAFTAERAPRPAAAPSEGPRETRQPTAAQLHCSASAVTLPPALGLSRITVQPAPGPRSSAQTRAALAALAALQRLGEACLRPPPSRGPQPPRTRGSAQSEECPTQRREEPAADRAPPLLHLFSPSQSSQRRAFARTVLQAAGATSVMDLGCGDARFLAELGEAAAAAQAGAQRGRRLAALMGVDLRKERISEAAGRLDKCWSRLAPGCRDCAPPPQRQLPSAAVFEGSLLAAAALPQARGWDAILMLEVVEHLADEATAAQAGATLLVDAAPRLAVVTTPNADCNDAMRAALRRLQQRAQACGAAVAGHTASGSAAAFSCGGFRDADHKFEWGRAAFKAWAHRAVEAAGGAYDVSFATIGVPWGATQEQLLVTGGASQAAVFVRREEGPAASRDGDAAAALLRELVVVLSKGDNGDADGSPADHSTSSSTSSSSLPLLSCGWHATTK